MPRYVCRECGSEDIEKLRSTWQRTTTTLTPDEMLEMSARGYVLREVGQAANISGERVRQVLNARFPGWQDVVRDQRAWEVLAAAFAKRAETAVPCIVCGCWVLRSHQGGSPNGVRTCSRECAVRWVAGRYQLDPDFRNVQRLRQARTVLKRPEKYQPVIRDWARRVLAAHERGEEWVPNRQWVGRNSRAGVAAGDAALSLQGSVA